MTKSGLRELKTGFRRAVFFAAALDFADYAMSDQQTWVDLVGHIGSDVVKGAVATEVGVIFAEAGLGVLAAATSAPVLAGVFAIGAVSAIAVFFVSWGIDWLDDNELHMTDKLIAEMKKDFGKI